MIKAHLPHSAKDMAKPVNFFCASNKAKSVSLIGDFNGWNPDAHPMKQRPDGWWFIEVPLTHGHHRYLFVADGVPTPDPRATGTVVMKPFGRVSVIGVS